MTVVALRALGLGDLLTAVPALRALRRAHPAARLVLVAPAWQWSIARAAGVDEVLPADGRHGLDGEGLVEALRRWSATATDPIEVAVNLHGRGPQSTRVLAALEPGRLVAYSHPDAPPAAQPVAWDPAEHEVERWCRLLAAHGVPADPTDLRLDPSPGVAPPIGPGTVIVHPGAATTGRRWPAPRFGAVAAWLLAAGRRVAYTGDASERSLCDDVRAAAGGGQVLAGRTALPALVAAVAGADAVLANDTGVAHLATACGTPSVVLFGPEPPSRWGPPPSGRHRALWNGQVGDPRAERLDPGLAAITVADVVEALGDVLANPATPNSGQSAAISPGAE